MYDFCSPRLSDFRGSDVASGHVDQRQEYSGLHAQRITNAGSRPSFEDVKETRVDSSQVCKITILSERNGRDKPPVERFVSADTSEQKDTNSMDNLGNVLVQVDKRRMGAAVSGPLKEVNCFTLISRGMQVQASGHHAKRRKIQLTRGVAAHDMISGGLDR